MSSRADRIGQKTARKSKGPIWYKTTSSRWIHFIFDAVNQIVRYVGTFDVVFDVFPEISFFAEEGRAFGVHVDPLQ